MHVGFQSSAAHPRKDKYQIVYIGRKVILDKDHYIVGIRLNTLDINGGLVHFILKYTPRSAHYHQEPIAPELYKFGNNSNNVFNLGLNVYNLVSYIKIKLYIILKSSQLLNCLTYYSQRVCISYRLLVKFEKFHCKPHSTFFLRYYEQGYAIF